MLRTDIAGFVGIATRGPLHQPLPIQSWRQFQAYFGDFTGAGYLAYAVRAFFENGGQRCWVVRVASETAATASVTLQSESLGRVWTISASSPGVWGNDLDIVVRETHRAQTLTVPQASAPEFSTVISTTRFGRGTQVRLSQGANKIYKVVSDVDVISNRLLWVNPKPEAQLPYDSVLSGFDVQRPILVESIEYTLWVKELGRMIRVYEGLSLVPEHRRYGPTILGALLPCFSGQPLTLPSAPEPVSVSELRSLPLSALESIATTMDKIIPLTGGADGLAQLSTYDFIGEDTDPLDSDLVRARKARGLRALEEIREVAVVAVPDIHIQPKPPPRFSPPPPCVPDPCLPLSAPPLAKPRAPSVGDLPPVFSESAIYQVQSALIQQCEKLRDRIALLDPPFSASRDDKLGVGAVRAWRSRFDSKYAAFYYPWLRVVDPLRSPVSTIREIPPSGHVAGQYAQSDFQFGVHKAPANAPLIWAEDVTVFVNDAVHGILNPGGINAIRPLPGRGLRIFGARTVSSDTDWQYVNVRRLMMMIEKAIEVAIQWAVFEPNSTLTRAKLNLTLGRAHV